MSDGKCICQDQHRRGYCTEPGCPYSGVHAQGAAGKTLDFFSQNVDSWGAAEWFDRLAKAVREQDAAVCAGDDLTIEMCRNVASSSAMRLVRDYEQQVRAALCARHAERRPTKQPPANLPDNWAYQESTNSVVCGGCLFRFGAEHPDGDGKWTCPNCGDGNGESPAVKTSEPVTVSCERCHGCGHIRQPGLLSEYTVCPDCDGNGYTVAAPKVCADRDRIARTIDPLAFRPQHMDDMDPTRKEYWLRRRNVAYYKADQIECCRSQPETGADTSWEDRGKSITRIVIRKPTEEPRG